MYVIFKTSETKMFLKNDFPFHAP